uniref:Transient receptor ion channel domain-containing protein n=1 Tax=Meloidogyne incognita TaxID=6306 RepID=A0A914M4R2_MELIC
MLGEGWAKYLDPSETATSEYSSDISPVILAAHLNQFEILQMLLRKDAIIEKPHKHYCSCEACEEERISDGLHRSLKRINTFRALASPAWISLTSSDPILSAFKLSRELQKRAKVEDEFKDQYLQLYEQCKQYAVDLLNQCRSTEEVMAVLNKEDNFCNEEVHLDKILISDLKFVQIDLSSAKCSLARLKLAIKYEQKTFVAHPHCQQLLTSIWYEGFPLKQHRSSFFGTLVICLLLVISWPILAICYILLPKSRIAEIVTFEAYRTQTGEIKGGGLTRAADRGPPPTAIEWLVFIWIVGMLWSEMKQLWQERLNKYVHQWWNWLDFAMLCLYLCTISIRLSAYLIYVLWNFNEETTPRHLIRTHWDAYEPMLVSEALFAVGNVFSFARVYYLFQTNPYLGPLQISLGCMLVDVAKFCIIFILIISSFSIGLAQLYWYYDANTPVCIKAGQCKTMPNAFSSIANSYMTLLWSLFSITKVEDTDVLEAHHFTVWVGQGLFILYHMASIIVLLNMLIAMMSHSFERINDHADLEWKFHRSKLWIAHFDEGSTLSPPFNIIITPKASAKAARAIVNTIRWCFGRYHYDIKDENRATIRRPGYSRKSHCSIPMETNALKKPVTYIEIIQRLVSRFIHEQKKTMKMDGVNEDELKEIKQDISSLRFELRDDRRKEIVRSSSHIDAVKREIMRSMSTSTRARVTMPRRHFSSFKERGVAEIESEDSDDIEIRNHIDSLSTFGTGATLSPTFSTAAAQLLPPAITVGASGDVSDVKSNEHYYMSDKFNYAERQRPKHKTSDAFEFFVGETGSLRYRSRTEACQRDSIRSDSAMNKRKLTSTKKSVKDNTSSIISIEVIHRLRESINEQLNYLVDQIEHQHAFPMHGDRISLEEYCENEVEQDDNGKDREPDREVKLREIPSGKQKSSTKSSPSRVSFAGSLNISKKNEDS